MPVSYKDYYKVLDVSRNATTEEISKAYKKMARKHHPDLNTGAKDAEEQFKTVNEAHEVLKDPEKRRLYDQLGPNWKDGQQFQGGQGFDGSQFSFNGQQFGGAGFSDFFETLFGQAAGGGRRGGFGPDPFGGFSSKPRRGRDIEAELSISLEDACNGVRRTITLNSQGGDRTLEVNIPAGIKQGAKLRLSGQGDASPNGQPGDLFLQIKLLPHSHFEVDGEAISSDLDLKPWEAALGCKMRVPTLEGEIELNIPPSTSSGRKFRLKGRGLGSGSNRADHLVRVMIKMPEDISAKEKEIWQMLEKEAQKDHSKK